MSVRVFKGPIDGNYHMSATSNAIHFSKVTWKHSDIGAAPGLYIRIHRHIQALWLRGKYSQNGELNGKQSGQWNVS